MNFSLFDTRNDFVKPNTIHEVIPHAPGIYCIRINDKNTLPKPFDTLLSTKTHNLIYIGLASKSLKRRLLQQELGGIGHGTFFRSIGAILGFRPPPGSLNNYSNKCNYSFITNDIVRIIDWLNNNVEVNWITSTGDLVSIETYLIEKYQPLLNMSKNSIASKELKRLRQECRSIANQLSLKL